LEKKLKQKIILILGVVFLVLLILFDIFVDFGSEDNKSEVKTSVETDSEVTPIVTNYKEKYYIEQTEMTEEEKEEANQYIYEQLVGDFLETQVFATQGNNDALKSLIDEKSNFGKKKIKELKSLYDKGMTLTLKSYYLDKFTLDSDNDEKASLYVVLYMGKIDKDEKVYEAKKSKLIYEIEKIEESDNDKYIFIGEKEWK
jgi:Na+-transporting methylmalonyl-CoA/oxaloacetate decarboxylase gamma subunit